MNSELRRIITRQGFVAVADAPHLTDVIKRSHQAGEVERLLPGVWVAAGAPPSWQTRVAAVQRRAPDAIMCGSTAASLLFGQPASGHIHAAVPGRRRPLAGVVLTERKVPPDLIVELGGGIRCTTPALTAVDLAAGDGGATIDEMLRRRLCTLPQLWEAHGLCERRRGNAVRERVLTESADEPWSQAERLAHRLLHEAGITGWVTNAPILVDGTTRFGDIVFEPERLILEIDGWQAHSSQQAFEDDRDRQNALVEAGWAVLRYTWTALTKRPNRVIVQTKSLLDLRRCR